MPIYEYQCCDCKHTMEIIQTMNEPQLETCPACGELSLVKQLTFSNFQFKGTGFYENDYKRKNKYC